MTLESTFRGDVERRLSPLHKVKDSSCVFLSEDFGLKACEGSLKPLSCVAVQLCTSILQLMLSSGEPELN